MHEFFQAFDTLEENLSVKFFVQTLTIAFLLCITHLEGERDGSDITGYQHMTAEAGHITYII